MLMHREDIKAEIRKKYGSLAMFERVCGLPRRSVEDVLRGRSVHRTATAIAAELGLAMQSLFSSRYEGKSSSSNADNIAAKAMPHSLNSKAA